MSFLPHNSRLDADKQMLSRLQGSYHSGSACLDSIINGVFPFRDSPPIGCPLHKATSSFMSSAVCEDFGHCSISAAHIYIDGGLSLKEDDSIMH